MAIIPGPTRPTHELGGAHFTSLVTPTRGSVETSVWIVEIDPGTPATPHSLTREEVFVVLDGTARVTIGGADGDAVAGDSFVVPPDTTFAVVNAGSAGLRMLCCLPVGGQARTEAAMFTPPWAE
jgi:quercetin dioxygenase-like cupin family protein